MNKSVRLISTSRYISKKNEFKAIQNSKEYGFEKITFNRIKKNYKNKWAGTPEERIHQLNEAFNSSAKIIWNCLGESGAIQIIKDIKFKKLKSKIVIGSSDFSLITNQLAKRQNMLAINGPNMSTTIKNESFHMISDIIAGKTITASGKLLYKDSSKIISGNIIGGNLISLTWLLGSKYEVDFRNKIVFFDKLGKNNISTFNNFVQLINSSKFKPKAIIITKFPTKHKKELLKMLHELFPSTQIMYDLKTKYSTNKISFPLEQPCIINCEKKNISFRILRKSPLNST